MKIMLLYPEVYEIARFKEKRKEYPPFGIMYLAAILEEQKHQVQIQKITPEEKMIDLSKFDIVSYGLSSSCTYNMILSSKKQSQFKKGVKIIVGGIHASIFPKQTLKDFEADAVIVGEGEITLPITIKNLMDQNYSDIKGVLYKNKDKTEIGNSDFMKNLDEIPFPARHLFPEEDFIFKGRLSRTDKTITHIHASRGCPYSCYFCGSLNKNHRYRSPENILKELNLLKQKYKIDGFVINDENFIINEKKVLEICKEVKKLNMPWSALSRVNTINEKIIKHLKKSNCIELKFGLETGSNKMMKYMNKNTTCEQAEKALSLCNKYGIKAKIFLIHGFPGENIDTTTETINFLKKNRKFINRITLFQWTPLPGSYVYNNPSKFGIDPKMLTFENAVIYGENQGFFLKDKINKEINESYLILNDFIKNSF